MDVRIIEANSHLELAHQMLCEVYCDENVECMDMRLVDICLYNLSHMLDTITEEKEISK